MTRADYLASVHVQQFIAYLVAQLGAGGRFEHRYYHRQTRAQWRCHSLYHAFEEYAWDGKTYDETRNVLQPLARELRQSVRDGDDALCRAVCVRILNWGGVGERKPANLSALDTLATTHGSLPAYFEKVRAHLEHPDFSTAALWAGLKMNSGFTKLYALLFDDFLIYDSRVGAALGLLVRHWCETQPPPVSVLPRELRFSYGYVPGKKAVRLSRNPSRHPFNFPSLRPDAPHTRHNVWANWLLTAALAQAAPDVPFRRLPAADQLRALEAALFMIGYDVRPTSNQAATVAPLTATPR